MRHPILFLAAFLAASCGAHAPAPRKAERPVSRVVIASADARRVSFNVAGEWLPQPQKSGEPVILQHADVPSAAIAVFFQPTELGSTIEDVTTRWAMVFLSGPALFTVTDLSKPNYLSEEASTFTISGVDKGVPMTSVCRIMHLGDPTADLWAIIYTAAPASEQPVVDAAIDRIARTIRLEPRDPSE